MKRLFDTVFVKNAEAYSRKITQAKAHPKQKPILKQAMNITSVVARNSAKIYQTEIQQTTAFKVVKHVITSIVPKNLPMKILKLKIHMQSLIGNTFGFTFSGLEGNRQKLRLME